MAHTKESPRKKNNVPAERKQKKHGRADSEQGNSQDAPPSKKPKPSTSISQSTANQAHTSSSSTSAAAQSNNAAASESSLSTATPASELPASTNEVTTMSILSSAHIEQKVTRVLDILSTFPPLPNERPRVVMLHAKAPVAAKMISIAEIAKRELTKEGAKWFQYNKVEQMMVQQTKANPKMAAAPSKTEEAAAAEGKAASDAEDKEDEEEEEAAAFETMKTPFERENEGKPKMKAVPVMSLYLSRVRVDSLRKRYGYVSPLPPPHSFRSLIYAQPANSLYREQTNALQVAL